MALIVQKFGGTSVGDTDRIRAVANRIKAYYEHGHQLAVVVSAMGKTTDKLVDMAQQLNENPRARELDIFGAPSFVVDGELFWGNERLASALERAWISPTQDCRSPP